MRRRIGAIVMAGLVFGPLALVSAQSPGPRVLVLDQQARTLTALEIPSGRALQTASLQGTPSDVLVAANGRRVLALDRGQGRDAGDDGFQARTRAAVTILDGASLNAQGRVELGWGLEPVTMLSAAGDRLSVVGPGYRGKTAAESLPCEVVTVDLATAKLLSRVELPRKATAFLATPDGATAVVLSAREERKGQVQAAELRFLDLATGVIAGSLALEGDPRKPVLSPDGQFLYLLDAGKPSNNPDKNVNGRLHVVSMASRTVQSVADAGSKPRGLVLDDQGKQLLLLSDGVPVKGPANKDRPGELRVIRGATASAAIPVGTSPEWLELSPDGKTLYVLGTYSATKVAMPDLKPGPPLTFKTWGEQLRVSPDGTRLYMVNGEYFKTYDLATGAQLTEVRTGRMSMKLLQALETGLSAEATRLEAENAARREGRSYYAYTEYTLAQPRGTMAIRPDGKAVYALNGQTDDLTVIDGVSGAILQKVPAGGFAVLFMPAASVALVPSADALHAVDFATHQKKADIVTKSPGNFDQSAVSPDGRLAVIHGSAGVLLVDASSGSPAATFKAFGQIADVAVDWGGTR